MIAFGCADNTMRVVDATNGKEVMVSNSHSDLGARHGVDDEGRQAGRLCGRDMAVKLTEVATQRFIDNMTSITPGALKRRCACARKASAAR